MKKRYVVAIVIVILLVTLAVFGITRGKVFDKSSDTRIIILQMNSNCFLMKMLIMAQKR